MAGEAHIPATGASAERRELGNPAAERAEVAARAGRAAAIPGAGPAWVSRGTGANRSGGRADMRYAFKVSWSRCGTGARKLEGRASRWTASRVSARRRGVEARRAGGQVSPAKRRCRASSPVSPARSSARVTDTGPNARSAASCGPVTSAQSRASASPVSKVFSTTRCRTSPRAQRDGSTGAAVRGRGTAPHARPSRHPHRNQVRMAILLGKGRSILL